MHCPHPPVYFTVMDVDVVDTRAVDHWCAETFPYPVHHRWYNSGRCYGFHGWKDDADLVLFQLHWGATLRAFTPRERQKFIDQERRISGDWAWELAPPWMRAEDTYEGRRVWEWLKLRQRVRRFLDSLHLSRGRKALARVPRHRQNPVPRSMTIASGL